MMDNESVRSPTHKMTDVMTDKIMFENLLVKSRLEYNMKQERSNSSATFTLRMLCSVKIIYD